MVDYCEDRFKELEHGIGCWTVKWIFMKKKHHAIGFCRPIKFAKYKAVALMANASDYPSHKVCISSIMQAYVKKTPVHISHF